MKIAIDCRMSGTKGIGTYLDETLPYLLNNKNYQYLLIGNEEKLQTYSSLNNVEIQSCDILPFSFKETFAFPPRLLLKINQCDAYYTPYCNIPSGIHKPIYSTIHDLMFMDYPLLVSMPFFLTRKFFYKNACFWSTKIFTVSEFSKERINYHLRTIKEVIVTYNGISSDYLNEFNKKNASAKKENYILFVGNIKQHNGLFFLIPAFLDARKKGLDAVLKIVDTTDCSTYGKLKKNKHEKNIKVLIDDAPQGSIELINETSPEKIADLYKKARLFVQPSMYEGFGIQPLEALYSNTNVLLSDIPTFKEIYNGFPVTFFKCADVQNLTEKILECYNNPIDISVIPDKYSYKNTAEIILKTIKKRKYPSFDFF